MKLGNYNNEMLTRYITLKHERSVLAEEGIPILEQLRDRRGISSQEASRGKGILRDFEEIDSEIREIERQAGGPPEQTDPIKPDPADTIREFGGNLSNRRIMPTGLSNGKIGVRSYGELFEEPLSDDGFDNFSEWTSIIMSRQYDPRVRRSISEGIPSEGGFLVPTAFGDAILTPSLEQSVILPRARVFPMKSSELVVPASVIGNHSVSCYGGVIAYWKAEKGSLSQADPTFRQMKLVANKLTVLSKASNEWLLDVERSGDLVRGILSEAVHWFLDKNFMIGTGAGQPLGLLNAACKVTVSKETGQAATTILYENIVKMFSSLYAGGINRAIWLIHPSVVPQLFTMSLAVGTGGIPVYMPADQGAGRPYNKLMGLPVVMSEKVETLGTEGDIILADLSQYGVGLRGELQLEASGAPAFASDETFFRLIIRVDGQPLWDEALTLRDGSTQVSPFVTLEART